MIKKSKLFRGLKIVFFILFVMPFFVEAQECVKIRKERKDTIEKERKKEEGILFEMVERAKNFTSEAVYVITYHPKMAMANLSYEKTRQRQERMKTIQTLSEAYEIKKRTHLLKHLAQMWDVSEDRASELLISMNEEGSLCEKERVLRVQTPMGPQYEDINLPLMYSQLLYYMPAMDEATKRFMENMQMYIQSKEEEEN